MTRRTAAAEILLVEDSPGDVLMTRTALEEARSPDHLHVVEDGAEAMAFLRQQGPCSGNPYTY